MREDQMDRIPSGEHDVLCGCASAFLHVRRQGLSPWGTLRREFQYLPEEIYEARDFLYRLGLSAEEIMSGTVPGITTEMPF